MKTKIGMLLALMLAGSAQAINWLPMSADSFDAVDTYSSEYTLPSGSVNHYVWDAEGPTCYTAQHGLEGFSEYDSLVESAVQRIIQDKTDHPSLYGTPGTFEEEEVIFRASRGIEGDFRSSKTQSMPSYDNIVCEDNSVGGIETLTEVRASGYNTVDLDDLYGQEGISGTVTGTLVGVLDNTGTAYVLINGSIDSGFKSEKVQIDPKLQVGGSLVYRPNNKLTLVGTILPQTVLGGDITEQSCDGESCHKLISEKRGDVVLGKAANYEELKKNKSLDFNLSAAYKLLQESEGDFVDLSGKVNASGYFDSDSELHKSVSLSIGKTLYQTEDTKVKASISPTTNGTNHSVGVNLSIDQRIDASSSVSVAVGSNYANGEFGAISANVGINHIAEDGSEFVIGITGNIADGESSIVPSLSIYPEEGYGFSISPIGFGITEKYQGRKYNHSLNPYMIIIQALLGQRTILDLLTQEEVQSLSQGQSVPKEDIIFDLPARDGVQLIHDRESQTIIGFDDNLEVILTIKVIEVGGYLFMDNLSGAFDSEGKLYKF